MLQRLVIRFHGVWIALASERSSPREIFWSSFIGGALGCAPAFFIRPWIALLLAMAFKKNKLWAWATAHVTGNWLTAPAVIFAEIEVSHRLRRGAWLPLTLAEAKSQGSVLFLDWALGSLPVGLTLGLVTAVGGYVIARTLARRPPPTSESPP